MSILQRKAQAGKQEHQARAMSVPKALRVSIAKIADQKFEMALAVIGATQERCEGDALSEKIDESALLIVLDGPLGSVCGVMVGPELVGALIQQQTMGTVSKTASSERELTSTDAALCAPLLDEMFQRSHALLETDADRDILCPYKFGARVEDKRLLALALDKSEYNIINLTIDVAAGAYQSTLTLLLPVLEKGTSLVLADEPEIKKPPRTLEKTVLNIHADLTAVLDRVNLPLSDLSKLTPGDVLSLNPDAFDTVEIMTRDRRIVSRGAMGQLEGKRAVQLVDPNAASNRMMEKPGELGQMEMSPVQPMSSGMSNEPMGAPPGMELGAIEHEPSEALDLPDLPDLPDMPDLPALDGDDGMPDFSDLPGLSDDGGLPDLPEIPNLPDLPDLDGAGELPALDDIPDFKIA